MNSLVTVFFKDDGVCHPSFMYIRTYNFNDSSVLVLRLLCKWVLCHTKILVFLEFNSPAVRSYAHSGSSYYDLFGNGKPGDKKFRKARESAGEDTGLWTGSDEDEGTTKKNQNHLEENIRNGSGKQGDGKFRAWEETDEDTGLWTRSDEDEDTAKKNQSHLKEEIRKTKQEAEKRAQLIDADDSDDLRSVWSGSDEDKTLWSGPECDDDDDIPTKPFPNEQSDAYLDKLFEFEETPKYRTIAEIYKDEEREELSPGKQARKVAVENALKKLKKGPDGRYINVWEVISDIDILIGAFENIVSGPEYTELREGGPKKLNMQFFKDIQARMRDPNFRFSPELKLKPKSKLVSRKKWLKAKSRQRKAQDR
ncbi:hypothetical protein GIB67_029968 [Kingdonia uniflora]|uniref:Uncharacterized protein n=1 Tax=Kingdonia uniflora TaxID=39325 RepID=A0A7J7MY52_9MAGN|nr:hypothetical protein GIB67_029968 [Kingdonia uniflora]